MDFKWITYSPAACSSTSQGTSINFLTSDINQEQAWQSGRFADFPVQVVLRLDQRVQLAHIQIASKQNRPIPSIRIYIGDGIYGSFIDAQYHQAGRSSNINSKPKQVGLTGIGSYLKFLFPQKPLPSQNNPHGQLGLSYLKVWGRPMNYIMNINQINNLPQKSDDIDKILMQIGLPLQLVIWSKENLQNFRHAPVDQQSRESLLELDHKRSEAFYQQDYGALKALTADIKKYFQIGSELLQLKRELKVASAKQDFDSAIILKRKIDALIRRRDSIDALYQTKRYQRMIVIGLPTEEHMSMVNKLLQDERIQAQMQKKKKIQQQEKQRKFIEELERQRVIQQTKIQRNPSPPRPKPRRPTKKKTQPQTIKEDPFGQNEGDLDLDQYLRPKIGEAGGNLRIASFQDMKRADVEEVLKIVGVKLWSSLYSQNWRLRLAGLEAFLEFAQAPLLPKYQADTRILFRAAIQIATLGCQDRVLGIYLVGLKILLTAMQPPICDTKVTPRMINQAMRIFIPILLNKVSQLNYRARDISMNTLIELFRHPNIRVGPLVDHIMILTAPNQGPVQKQPWRLMLARLQILLHIVQELGVNSREWNWKQVFHNLLVPCLEHANSDVRMTTVDIIVSMYIRLGMELRLLVDGLGNRLKPQLAKIIFNRMLEHDQKHPEGMPAIQELQEIEEHTPRASNKRQSWTELKAQISSLAAQEARKTRKKK